MVLEYTKERQNLYVDFLEQGENSWTRKSIDSFQK